MSDKSKLSNVLDVWGDGLYVSEGLFIAPDLAWKSICEFAEKGENVGKSIGLFQTNYRKRGIIYDYSKTFVVVVNRFYDRGVYRMCSR
ncbi:MAG: hypothetical protein K2N44_04425 [Lachnospiraceae bacterium]|nr:hypothetical protein [Lachnospiraceae bacterium]